MTTGNLSVLIGCGSEVENGMNTLTDRFGRIHRYLRMSITDRCNLRCQYCMPVEGIELKGKNDLLTFDEIEMLARIFVDLGIRKIRITGGEPLVRRGVEELCRRLASIPRLQALALTTNGVLLREKARALKEAGVQHLNISLDTLRPGRFEQITRRTSFHSVLGGLEAALSADFRSVKVNTVIIRGFNDDEILDFVEFARALSLNLRFIEYMPFLGNGWSEARSVPYREMKESIETRYELVPVPSSDSIPGPAKEFHLVGSRATIGFITTMSEHFCAACNRLRLTADGKLRCCLFARQESDLKRLLRNGCERQLIEQAIRAAVLEKWEKHPEAEELIQVHHGLMTAIGG
jgi:cyclic pyranopterin phosphate synthase